MIKNIFSITVVLLCLTACKREVNGVGDLKQNESNLKKQALQSKTKSPILVDDNKKENPKPKDVIELIRAKVKLINDIKNWSKVTQQKFTEETTEGGILSKYYLKSNLEKMIVKQYGEMGKSITEYYVNDGHLMFIYDEKEMYNTPIYSDDFNPENSEKLEFRYYFDGDSLIREIAPTGDIVLYNIPYFKEGTKRHLKNFNKFKLKEQTEF